MSEYIQLCKDGTAKLFKNDVDKREKFRIKKKDGAWNIVNRETKEVLTSFNDEAAADDFFYTESEIGVIWQNLRSPVKIEEGFTFQDLTKLIIEDSFLYAFVLNNFLDFHEGGWRKNDCDGLLFVHTCLHINKFSNELNFSYSVTQTDEGVGIVLNPLCICYEGSEKIHEYNYNYSLLDVISAFFTKIESELTIGKDGIYVDNYNVDFRSVVDDPFKWLTAECTINDDITLGDIFNIVEKSKSLVDFLSMYSWCGAINEFHKAARIPLEKKDEFTEKLWHLEIYRHVESSFSNYFETEPCFHGVGDIDETTLEHYKGRDLPLPLSMNYAIELCPMNELVDLPVVAKEDVKVQNKSLKLKYTLLEILDAIYWEISFFGGPDEADEMKNQLAEQVQEIKKDLDAGDMSKYSSVDEMLKDLDEEDEE